MVADRGRPVSKEAIAGAEVAAYWLGTVPYDEACRLQKEMALRRSLDQIGDSLLLLEHPPVITVGRAGGEDEVLATAAELEEAGIQVVPTDRGGRATYHGPGQLVAYPILKMPADAVLEYVERLEEVAIRVLAVLGLEAGRLSAHPGVWIAGRKIAAVGISVQGGVTRHGLSLNVSPDLGHYGLLVPCGIRELGVTSVQQELGAAPEVRLVAGLFCQAFAQVFACPVADQSAQDVAGASDLLGREGSDSSARDGDEQPSWLWRSVSAESEEAVDRMQSLLAGLGLHSVCQEARCPNVTECFGQGTATFLLLGDTCTRGCRFCAVKPGRPTLPDPAEADRVAEAAGRLGLIYVVLTSVTRDDLSDGGASVFAAAIVAVRRSLPGAGVEVLVPDFRGSVAALETVLAAAPDVLNHNLETVPRLYSSARPGADYSRSLRFLAAAKERAPNTLTKSGLMLGLGERTSEVLRVLAHLREAHCDLLTLGQYLQPDETRLPINRYVPPHEFAWYADRAAEIGFRGVASAPLVRSSHRAAALWSAALTNQRRGDDGPSAPSETPAHTGH